MVWFILLGLVTSQASAADPGPSTLAFLDSHGGRWVSDHSCVSCHSAWSYAMARVGTSGWQASPLAQTLVYISDRQSHWETIDPWYGARGNQKGTESFGSEAILEASIIIEAEKAGEPTSLSQSAVRHLLDLQQADGSFPWLDYHLEPLESSGGAIWGAAVARVAIARSDLPLENAVTKLDKFLGNQFSMEKTSLYCRLAIAWAAAESGAILSSSQLNDLFQAVESLQRQDGGWSMNDLGPWTKQGSSAEADANATSFVLLVLNSSRNSHHAQDSDLDRMASAARTWLETHQNADGSWSGVSVNYDSDFNRSLMTDFATGMAFRALTLPSYQK